MTATPSSPPRSVSDSLTEMTELVLPPHTNALGTVFGGQVMAWVDICAAVTAQRHCGQVAVTAAVDELIFLAPIHLGEICVLSARINAAFSSSMEVEVLVHVEDPCTRERRLCADALLTFVNLDRDTGKPMRVPPLAAHTPDEQQRADEARARRAARLARRKAASGNA